MTEAAIPFLLFALAGGLAVGYIIGVERTKRVWKPIVAGYRDLVRSRP